MSEPDDQLNLCRNYSWIEDLSRGRQLLFSAIQKEVLLMIDRRVDWNRYAGSLIEKNFPYDKARDNHHPGKESHRRLAQAYIRKLQELCLAGQFKG